jgi:hypothetical protein
MWGGIFDYLESKKVDIDEQKLPKGSCHSGLFCTIVCAIVMGIHWLSVHTDNDSINKVLCYRYKGGLVIGTFPGLVIDTY